MKKRLTLVACMACTLAPAHAVLANDTELPELLGALEGDDMQLLSAEEAAGTRGESMKKQETEYGFCGLRRCTRMFVNNEHVYTVYEDGSVYFVHR